MPAGGSVVPTGLLAARDDALMLPGDAALLVAYLDLFRCVGWTLATQLQPSSGAYPVCAYSCRTTWHGVIWGEKSSASCRSCGLAGPFVWLDLHTTV